MDTSKAKKNSKKKDEEKEREYIKLDSHEVLDVRVIDTQKGDMVLFTLVLNGVKVYSCRVATGKNGDFISMPQTKGSNGQYYNVVYAPLSDEDTKTILDEVQTAINNM